MWIIHLIQVNSSKIKLKNIQQILKNIYKIKDYDLQISFIVVKI